MKYTDQAQFLPNQQTSILPIEFQEFISPDGFISHAESSQQALVNYIRSEGRSYILESTKFTLPVLLDPHIL